MHDVHEYDQLHADEWDGEPMKYDWTAEEIKELAPDVVRPTPEFHANWGLIYNKLLSARAEIKRLGERLSKLEERPTHFTFFWKEGKRDILRGSTVEDAFAKAGYGAGAMAALDFFSPGEDTSYEFIKGKWQKKEPKG